MNRKYIWGALVAVFLLGAGFVVENVFPYMGIKPWRMKDARLDGHGAYICGDSTYPGQGIPGACLSGIIAVEKLMADHR